MCKRLMSCDASLGAGITSKPYTVRRRMPGPYIRQFESTAETDRIRLMKAKSSSKSLNRNPKFAAGVERALIRAEEAARRAARMYGTPLYVWENGKVVAKRP